MLQRKKTILLHLVVSAAVVGTLVAIIFLAWYPGPFFRISGAETVLATLIGVDLVLGPLLTVYLYKPGKPTCSTPATETAAASSMSNARSFSCSRWIASPCCPSQTSCTRAVRSRPARRRRARPALPWQCRPTTSSSATCCCCVRSRTASSSSSSPSSGSRWPTARGAEGVERVLDNSGRDATELRWVPVVNKRLDAFALVIDAATAEPVDVIAVDPWEPGA